MYRVILFDLDGTLTDSGEGILKSVQYAIGGLGRKEPPMEELRSFVGPPLKDEFMRYCNISEEQAVKAVELYRERYHLIGLYENTPYPEICQLLQNLKDAGYILGVASSKPEVLVEKILNYFSMYDYFDAVVGSELSGERVNKDEVVEEALRRLKFEKYRDEVVLVGDRKYDVYGARSAGLDCVAVSYGYGSKEELNQASPVAIADSVEELNDFFVQALPKKPFRFIELWRMVYPIGVYEAIMMVMAMGISAGLIIIGASGDTIQKSALWATGFAGLVMIPLGSFLYLGDEHKRFLPDRYLDSIGTGTMIGLFCLGGAMAYFLNLLMSMLHVFERFPSYTQGISNVFYENPFWVTLLCGGLIGPIAEELVFRGLLYRRMRDFLRPTFAMAISALIFGAFHGNMAQFIYASILGLFLAWFMEYYRSIWASILIHVGANSWTFVLSFFGKRLAEYAGGFFLYFIIVLQLIWLVVAGVHYIRKGIIRER